MEFHGKLTDSCPQSLQMLRVLTRSIRMFLGNWLRVTKLQQRYPELLIELPTKVIFDSLNAFEIGKGVNVGPFSEIIVLQDSSLSKVNGKLLLGDSSTIGAHANIRAVGGTIVIKKNALIAQNVAVIACNHALDGSLPYRLLPWSEEKTGVIIGQNAWVGAGAILLPGSSVGENSVIGAGSVVSSDVPPNEIWAGVPARKIRDLK